MLLKVANPSMMEGRDSSPGRNSQISSAVVAVGGARVTSRPSPSTESRSPGYDLATFKSLYRNTMHDSML